MSAAIYDVTYTESRNRVTTFFRYILAIPHLVVSAAWGWFAQVLALVSGLSCCSPASAINQFGVCRTITSATALARPRTSG